MNVPIANNKNWFKVVHTPFQVHLIAIMRCLPGGNYYTKIAKYRRIWKINLFLRGLNKT
jgi:hypothetical protein